LTASLLVGCCRQSVNPGGRNEVQRSQDELRHCTSAIEKSIAATDPAAGVTCDLQSRNVTVTTGKSAADIAAAIKKAGYESELLAG
jgi:copper chaperone